MKFDPKVFSELNILRIPCGKVAGECSIWEGKRKFADWWPPKLIREIMRQGYSRKVADLCAIEFHDKRPVLEKVECIVVKSMGKEIARLKPLKFYNMA